VTSRLLVTTHPIVPEVRCELPGANAGLTAPGNDPGETCANATPDPNSRGAANETPATRAAIVEIDMMFSLLPATPAVGFVTGGLRPRTNR